MDFVTIVEQTAKAAEKNIQILPCDYYGEDGLLRCGRCNGLKEYKPPPEFGINKVKCICKCEDERRKKEQKEWYKKAKTERLRREAFTNPQMLEFTFDKDDGKNPIVATAARNYATRFEEFKKLHKGLLFYGGVGTGKSFISACVVNELLNKGISARFTNFSEIEAERRDDENAIKDLNRFDLLVLDDFATERDTAYMNEIVFAVIDSRIQAGLPMIVTTNLTADDLKRCADPDRAKVISRLLGACEPIEVKGDDRRRQQLRNDHADIKKMLGI